MTTNVKLLPCPFCGEVKDLQRMVPPGLSGYVVSCNGDDKDCCAEGPYKPTAEEAIKAWNTRKGE